MIIPDPLANILKSWENPPIFSGLPHENVSMWLSKIRLGCKMRGVPRQQWTDVAIRFLAGDLKDVVSGLYKHLKDSGSPEWEWEAFQLELIGICEEAKRNLDNSANADTDLQKFARNHPYLATSAGVALVGTGALVVAPALALGALNLVGFSAAGPVAGSAAAGLQSIFYGGATTGLFSVCQSFAMTTVAASPAALTGACAAISGGTWFVRNSAGGSAPAPPPDGAGVTVSDVPPPPYEHEK